MNRNPDTLPADGCFLGEGILILLPKKAGYFSRNTQSHCFSHPAVSVGRFSKSFLVSKPKSNKSQKVKGRGRAVQGGRAGQGRAEGGQSRVGKGT